MDSNLVHIGAEASLIYPDFIPGVTCVIPNLNLLTSARQFGDMGTIKEALNTWDNFNIESGLPPESTWAYDLAVANWIEYYESRYMTVPIEHLFALGIL